RPGQFDAVMDFSPMISPARAQTAPAPDLSIPVDSRSAALLLNGVALLATGGFFAGLSGVRSLSLPLIVSISMIGVGLVFLMSAVGLMIPSGGSGQLLIRDAWAQPVPQGMTGGVYLTIENGTRQDERLIGVSSDAAESVEIHQTQIENDL